MGRFSSYIAASAVLAAVASCLNLGPGEPPMCQVTADCDHQHGEICDEGICWGNPPPGVQFGAIVMPPDPAADGTALVPSEIPVLDIASDGTVSNLLFAPPVTLSGRVLLSCPPGTPPATCDPARSVAARIWVQRRSLIPGGPVYARSFEAHPGLPAGEVAFSMVLPQTRAEDPPYEVTVVPDDGSGSGSGVAPAAFAPPLRFVTPAVGDARNLEWMLGIPNEHKTVTGRVETATGTPLGGQQVVALGRWSSGGPLEAASSLATTDAGGRFRLSLPIAATDVFDVVVRSVPPAYGPTLRLPDAVILDQPATDIGVLRMPAHPAPRPFVVSVRGITDKLERVPVAGAGLQFTSVLASSPPGPIVTFTARGQTDKYGNALLHLIPGDFSGRDYLAQVESLPESRFATVQGIAFQVGSGGSGVTPLPEIVLPRRVKLSGRLATEDKIPVQRATVSAAPSPSFAWKLPVADQEQLDGLQYPSATSDRQGRFELWLDPRLAGKKAVYDLDLAPPAEARAPRGRRSDVAASTSGSTDSGIDLGTLRLPHAAFARGTVGSTAKGAIAGAQVLVYEHSVEFGLCEEAILRPGVTQCVPPAHLRGIWQSRKDGQVWLVLPDPRPE